MRFSRVRFLPLLLEDAGVLLEYFACCTATTSSFWRHCWQLTARKSSISLIWPFTTVWRQLGYVLGLCDSKLQGQSPSLLDSIGYSLNLKSSISETFPPDAKQTTSIMKPSLTLVCWRSPISIISMNSVPGGENSYIAFVSHKIARESPIQVSSTLLLVLSHAEPKSKSGRENLPISLKNERAGIEDIAIIWKRRTTVRTLALNLCLLGIDQLAGIVLGVHDHDILAWVRCRNNTQLLLCPAIPEVLVFFASIHLAVDACGDLEKGSD